MLANETTIAQEHQTTTGLTKLPGSSDARNREVTQ
jgi:hypothetical protein